MRLYTRLPNLPVPHHVLRLSRTEAPSLPQHYPASSVLLASPPPYRARPVPHGRPVDHPDHAVGLPVLRALSLCTCRRHYPGAAAGCIPRSSHPTVSAFPGRGRRVGPHIDLFEACSAFTRVAACTLALSPIRDTLIEGFSHFVTSMTAPIASGWSESPGGACTHWKAPPWHGAHPKPSFEHRAQPCIDAYLHKRSRRS